MSRSMVGWVVAACGWLLMACAPSASAQRQEDERMEMRGQPSMAQGTSADTEGCGCPMHEDGGCPGCGQGGEACGCAQGMGGGSCPMGKACPMHHLPKGTKAIVDDTPDGSVIRLESPSSDPASVDAVRKAARMMAKMVEQGCPMMKKGTPPPPAR